MDITVRNEAILKMAKSGATLQEIVDVYGTSTSNISTLLNRLGYKKCEIVVKANNTLLVNQEIIVINPLSKADYINNRSIYKLLVEKYKCVILGDDNVYKFKEDCFHIPIFKTKQELIKYLNKE